MYSFNDVTEKKLHVGITADSAYLRDMTRVGYKILILANYEATLRWVKWATDVLGHINAVTIIKIIDIYTLTWCWCTSIVISCFFQKSEKLKENVHLS